MYLDKGLVWLWVLSGIAIVNSAVNGYDGSMMNGLQSLSQWQDYFQHPTGGTLGLVNAMLQAGGVCAVPLSAHLTDWFGRKLSIAIGCVIIIVGVIMQTAASNIHIFTGARFIIGFGLAISSNAAPILVAELAHPKFRGKITGLYNTSWAFGSIMAAWITYGTQSIPGNASWRIPSALQGAATVFLLICLPMMPESPRWLVGHGRNDEARRILSKLHANGNDNDPLVELEMTEIEEAIRYQKDHERRSWLELVATRGNRYRMFIGITVGLFSQWSGNGLLSYYLFQVLDNIGITASKTQLLINGAGTIWGYLMALTGAMLTDRVNRRTQFLGSTIGIMVSWTILTGLTGAFNNGSNHAGIGVIIMIFAYSSAYGLAWTPLTALHPIEIMPYNIRAKGLAVSAMAVNIALFFNSYVNPIGIASWGWKFYLVYVVWIPFEILTIYLFYPETRGRTLEELAVIFDGEAAKVAGNADDINADGIEVLEARAAGYAAEMREEDQKGDIEKS